MKTSCLLRVVVSGAAAIPLLGHADGVAAAIHAEPTCFGRPATIVGAPGVARVVGTAGPDVIFSRWDDQVIHGGRGRDVLCGQSDISGGRGDDLMQVRSERAFLDASSVRGGPGDDFIRRSEALDPDPHFANLTFGGPGNDSIVGSPNLDEIHAGPGRDRVSGLGLHDAIYGGRGADTVAGNEGDDLLWGGDGDDLLKGHPGEDTLWGQNGDDDLRGRSGDDLGRGGPGDDQISGHDGMDEAVGGLDVDWCVAEVADCEVVPAPAAPRRTPFSQAKRTAIPG